MKYTDSFGNSITNGDTTKEIKKEESNSYDLILSDPPYNINYSNNRRIKTRDKIHGVDGIKNDKDNLEMINQIYNEYFRILKEGKHIYIFTRWDVAQQHIDLLEKAGFIIKNNLIWMKNSWSMGDLFGDYAGQYENILFGYKPYSKGSKKGKGEKLKAIGEKKRHSNILQYDRKVGKDQIHSHQKPIDLLQFLIKKSTCLGDRIYDGFLGSNSLGLAAISTLRKYSGVEMETTDDFFNKMKNRSFNITDKVTSFISNKKNFNKAVYIPELFLFIKGKDYSQEVYTERHGNKKYKIEVVGLEQKDFIDFENFNFYYIKL